eukprot:SM000053S17466  [mRNA]  locus=s53:514065:516429:- [translate_table: standard]
MQRNPGARTIEGELEAALHAAGGISAANFGDPRKVDWMRAARTDKGVSAVGQVVSARVVVDPPGFVERVNDALPPTVRLLGYTRVTNTFNAKAFCDRRRYEYVLPAFAFDPDACRDKAYIFRSLLTGEELAAARGADAAAAASRQVKGEVVRGDSKGGAELTDVVEAPKALAPGDNSDGKAPFVFTDDIRRRLASVLRKYCGTHTFHNFTARTSASDPAANRFIVSFEVGGVFSLQGTEYVRVVVVGQSFMLHQIRKMVGLAVAVMRGCCPPSLIDRAFCRDENVNVPMAPELGLFLDECLFHSYNRHFGLSHAALTMAPFAPVVEAFKRDHVYAHIAATERSEGTVAAWIRSLNERNYPDFAAARLAAAATSAPPPATAAVMADDPLVARIAPVGICGVLTNGCTQSLDGSPASCKDQATPSTDHASEAPPLAAATADAEVLPVPEVVPEHSSLQTMEAG